jgi:hypothetical protein
LDARLLNGTGVSCMFRGPQKEKVEEELGFLGPHLTPTPKLVIHSGDIQLHLIIKNHNPYPAWSQPWHTT